MADDKPAGQAATETGKGTLSNPAASAAPAAGANADPNAKPAGDGNAAGAAAAAAGGDGSQTGKEGDKAGAAAAASKVPDKYELTVPEGADDYVNAAFLETWAKRAKDAGWSNDEAQQQLAGYATYMSEQSAALRKQTEEDPTYGKENLEANQQLARRLIERVRPKGHPRAESFNRFLLENGAGNHIEVFAFLADIGRMMAEDKPPAAGGTAKPAETRSAADVLYGGK